MLQSFRTISVRVHTYSNSHFRIAVFIDVDMTDAFAMAKHRNTCNVYTKLSFCLFVSEIVRHIGKLFDDHACTRDVEVPITMDNRGIASYNRGRGC